MAIALHDEIQEMLKSGDVTEVTGGFTKKVRNIDQDPLDVGDVFTIPQGYKVLSKPLFTGGEPVEFTMVTVTNKKTGVTRNTRIFPNQFAKAIRPVVNGMLQPKVKTAGTAAAMYQSFADKGERSQQMAIDAMAGKPIEITAKTPYQIFEFGTVNIVPTSIFTYDFVEEEKKATEKK